MPHADKLRCEMLGMRWCTLETSSLSLLYQPEYYYQPRRVSSSKKPKLTYTHAHMQIQGGFSAAIGAAAMALSNPNRQLKYHLYVLLREHLHAVQGANKQLSQQAQLVREIECSAHVSMR
jgi:hypothetical protein